MIEAIILIILFCMFLIFEIYYFTKKDKHSLDKLKKHIEINKLELQKKTEIINSLKHLHR